jgi:hydroxyacyl-ACP dehydratase HTD2-like protein with hotdog domain
MKERKKQKTKKQFLSNSLFKESKKKKRVTLSFKLSIQRVQVKEEEKQTSFQSHFTHLFLRRARKTKITLCFDGYLILLITPGSSLFTLSEEENRRVWDVSLGEV